MARPSTPKLPVNQTLLSEVLQRVSNAKTKDEKVSILREYKTEALTKILLCNFASTIRFVFPPGRTPFKEIERPKGTNHAMMIREHRMIDRLIRKTVNGITYFGCSGTTRPTIQQLKKEQLWIQLLEELHPEEANLMDLVKDKKLTEKYKITRQNVIDAFPELQLQNDPDARTTTPPAPKPKSEPKSEETPAPVKKPVKRARRRTPVRPKSVSN